MIDYLIDQHRNLWDGYTGNKFCQQMATAPPDSIELAFQNYAEVCIQVSAFRIVARASN